MDAWRIHQLFWRVNKRTFALPLRLFDGRVEALSGAGGHVEFHYTVPPTVCRNGRMSLGTLMALLDEISGVSFVVGDKTHRPGVSVAMHAAMHKPVFEGEEIILRSRIRKAGRLLGFAEMSVTTPAGEPIVSGEHTKYLPFGQLWDVMLGPTFGNVTLDLFERNEDTLINWSTYLSPSRKETTPPPAPDDANIYDLLGFEDVEGGGIQARLHSLNCNPLGFLHGGATIMLAEVAAERATGAGEATATSLQATYMSSNLGLVSFREEEGAASTREEEGGRLRSRVLTSSNGGSNGVVEVQFASSK